MNELYIFFPILLPSTNKWETLHYQAKDKLKKNKQEIIYKILENYKHFRFNKVKITFQTFLGTEIERKKSGRKKTNETSRDIINNAPTIKLIEDCIVRSGILKDDNADNVVEHNILSNKIDRKFLGSGILVFIQEIKNERKDLQDYFNLKVKPEKLLSDYKILEKENNKTKKEKEIEIKEEIKILDKKNIWDDYE